MSGWKYVTFTTPSFRLVDLDSIDISTSQDYYPFNRIVPAYCAATGTSGRIYNATQLAEQMEHIKEMVSLKNTHDFISQFYRQKDANEEVVIPDTQGATYDWKIFYGNTLGSYITLTEKFLTMTYYVNGNGDAQIHREFSDTDYPDYYDVSAAYKRIGIKCKVIDCLNTSPAINVKSQNTIGSHTTELGRYHITHIEAYEWLNAQQNNPDIYVNSLTNRGSYGNFDGKYFIPTTLMFRCSNFVNGSTPLPGYKAVMIKQVNPELYTDDGVTYFGKKTISGMDFLTTSITGLIDTTNVNMSDYTPQPTPGEEPEYMNELNNRFSPRAWAGSIGNYIVPASDITKVMDSIMEKDFADVVLPFFSGSSDGKDMIVGLRWYWGFGRPGSPSPYIDSHRFPIKVGKYMLTDDNLTIYAYRLVSEYFNWSTSELEVPKYFNNYLDFMCSYQLYLPYYGFLDIDPNDIVGGTIKVHYNINWCTGMTNIVVECKNDRTDDAATKFYTLNTQIGEDIPIAGDVVNDWKLAWAQTCGKAFITGAKIGMGAGTQDFNAYMKESNAAENYVLKNEALDEATKLESIGNIRNTRDEALQRYRKAEFGNNLIQNGVNSINPIQSVTRSGSFNAETGNLDELHPYLLITKPVSVEPADYEEYVGVPSADSVVLNNCSGFTQVAAVKPTPVLNTLTVKRPKYLNEIISQLQAGVYL